MKIAVAILAIAVLTAAAPKPTKLHFRNLFKEIKSRPLPRIIGGQEATPHSIPYQVFLEIHNATQSWYCGGSLISTNFILTAGHCAVDGVEAAVTLGAHNLSDNEPTQIVVISDTIMVHENYHADILTYDIALIRLPATVILTNAIKTVSLPHYADDGNTLAGATARISGWGLTDIFGDALSDVLNYVDVEVITNQECGEFFDDLLTSMICTSGDDATGSCSGDAGGPLVVDGVQIGVASFGIVYCLPGFPTVFTRTTSFLGWISEYSDVEILG